MATSASFDERLAETYERLGDALGHAGGARRRTRAPLVARGRDLRRRGRDGRRQGAGRGRHHPGPDRGDDQHLGVAGLPGALVGGRGAPPARPADQLPQLRPGQRLPGLRQRHPARRDHDRRPARPTTRCWSTPRARGSPRRSPSIGWPRPDATADGSAVPVRHPHPGLGRRRDGARPGRPALRRAIGWSAGSAGPAPSTTTCASAT